MPYILIRSIMWVLFRIAYTLYSGIRFEGRENVPRRGAVLITPNHISDADPPAVGLGLPRTCYFMAKEELFSMRYVGPLIRMLHGFPVKPNTADRVAIRRAEEVLKQGEALVMFPEGKISPDGKLLPILPGAIMIAQRSGTPIVPTIVEHTDSLMPYGTTRPRFSKRPVVVRFGPPVTVEDLIGRAKGGEALKRGADRLHALLTALQERRPYPPKEDYLQEEAPAGGMPTTGEESTT